MIDQKIIGCRIQQSRKQQKITVEQLAETVGISPEFLRAIESGQKGMSLNTLTNLSVALQISTDYLLFGSPSDEKYLGIIQILETCPENHLDDLAIVVKKILELSQ